MKALRLATLICLLTAVSFATTTVVNPTGACSPGDLGNSDVFAVGLAIDSAAPGDTVQLGPGTFNFSCMAEFGGGPSVFTPNVTINGTPGATIIVGPGFATDDIAAFEAAVNGVHITNLKFVNMIRGVFVDPKLRNFVLTDCEFDNVFLPVQVARLGEGARILRNVMHLPAPLSNDPGSLVGSSVGIFIARGNSFVLVADNTITGPGRSANVKTVQDLFSPELVTRSIGIFQLDNVVPASTYGRISNNHISGVDAGIQSSSNFGVVSNNTVTATSLALIVSNDTNDGVTSVTGNVVTGNILGGNQVGLWMASATQNVISLNDARENSLAGLLFLANTGGAASDTNMFVLNQGSKLGVPGNQGLFVKKLRE